LSIALLSQAAWPLELHPPSPDQPHWLLAAEPDFQVSPKQTKDSDMAI
jgi:hypothetical protein